MNIIRNAMAELFGPLSVKGWLWPSIGAALLVAGFYLISILK